MSKEMAEKATKSTMTEGKSNVIAVVDEDSIRNKIYEVRGVRIMLDFELAEIYGYETKNFNRQVKNNAARFEGEDFMFQLTREEVEKNYENWENYWAREMVFYYRKIKTEGKPVTVTAIMKMTNTRKHNLIRGIPYLDLYTDSETAAAIRELLTG